MRMISSRHWQRSEHAFHKARSDGYEQLLQFTAGWLTGARAQHPKPWGSTSERCTASRWQAFRQGLLVRFAERDASRRKPNLQSFTSLLHCDEHPFFG